MNVQLRPIAEVKPYHQNAKKHPDKQVKQLAASITEFGFNQPLVADKDGVLIVGHGRLQAARYLGLTEVPVITLDIDEEKARAYRIADNKLAESAWDKDMLYTELSDLTTELLNLTGFTELDLKAMEFKQQAKTILKDDFIIPPLSVWDTKMDYWQKRKELWREVFGDSRDGRSDSLLGEGLNKLAALQNSNTSLSGTSEFDPVVAEICYRWFCPPGGKILDPFAGGAVRGAVAGTLGYQYLGVDLSEQQVESNRKQNAAIEGVEYRVGNSVDIPTLVPEDGFDFIFSCPPYYDLEVYSDDPEDLSNKGSYTDFVGEYNTVIRESLKKLKPNRFAVFVVGDIRGPEGHYEGFVPDTIRAFQNGGAGFYNDIVLLNALATATLRVRKSFQNRKVVKVHQNVLCFFKNEAGKVAEAYANLPQVVQEHENVLVFYKGDIDQIRKEFVIVKTEMTI